ncbi:MAG: hypothetical protein K8W52_06715 [Deltaproteobacteria bacterium]|nr:hypothetical protein [Deltaproteobacteria bacterium]
MRLVASSLALALALVACVPTRHAVFEPVARDVAARIGPRPAWMGGAPDAAAIDALIASPLTADRAAALALVASAELAAEFDQLGIAAADVAAATAPGDPTTPPATAPRAPRSISPPAPAPRSSAQSRPRPPPISRATPRPPTTPAPRSPTRCARSATSPR